MENKEEKKTISDQSKIDKKRLGKVIIFLFFFGFLLIFISNYKYFSDSFQQFFSFQKEDTIEEAFEETILDELSHLRKDFELIDPVEVNEGPILENIDKEISDLKDEFSVVIVNDGSTEKMPKSITSYKNIKSVQIINIKTK